MLNLFRKLFIWCWWPLVEVGFCRLWFAFWCFSVFFINGFRFWVIYKLGFCARVRVVWFGLNGGGF